MVREAYHCTWGGQAVCLPDDTVPQITLPAVSLALGSHWPVKPHLGSRAILLLDHNRTVLHHEKKKKKKFQTHIFILLSETVNFKVSVLFSSQLTFFHKGSAPAMSSPTDIGQCLCLSPSLGQGISTIFSPGFYFHFLLLACFYEIGFGALPCYPTRRTTMLLRRWPDRAVLAPVEGTMRHLCPIPPPAAPQPPQPLVGAACVPHS